MRCRRCDVLPNVGKGMQEMVEEFGTNCWLIDGDEARMFSIPFPTRMAAIRLKSGGIWLHSPVVADDRRRAAVSELGSVSHLICPNRFHHLFAGDWQRAHPEAQLWGGPGLQKKRPDLRFDGELSDDSPEEWREEIDQLVFRGSSILPEVVFFHRASRSLILTDVIQNHEPSSDGWFWRKIKRWNGIQAPDGGVPRDLRLTYRDKEAARESLKQVLAWDFDRVILSHGTCIDHDARAHVERAFGWLAEAK